MPANHVAKWDGTAWSALGAGMDNDVQALALDGDGNLYGGGQFTTAGGIPASRIAKWDGTAWSALGAGMDSSVLALALDGEGNLYAGGYFTSAGGTPANNIAKWDGTAWSALGAGMDGSVLALALDGGGNLYSGGEFTTAGDMPANHIARWDGTAWSPLGAGIIGLFGDDRVYTLAVDGEGNLYAGGYFTTAGDKASDNIAQWINTPPTPGDDSFIVPQDSQDNPLEVLANDSDPESDPLSITAVSTPDQGGTALIDGTQLIYTPPASFSGVETFTYTVSDGYGGFTTAKVVVRVGEIRLHLPIVIRSEPAFAP
jgi:hypothetical protein